MQNDILGFDVSVDNLVRVKLINGLTDLSHDAGNFGFGHRLQFFELFEELASHSDLHQKVDIVAIVKKSKHSYYVRMIEEALNFELSDELFCYLFFS